MSFVFATPEYLAAAAADLASLGSAIGSANAAAAGPTSGVLAAGADEVSATVAALFGAHAQAYQELSAQAALFHQQFVQLMTGGAGQYALAEAANASPLGAVGQAVMSGVVAPLEAAAGAPASGAGATGMLTAGTGGAPGAFGPGTGGASGQLVSSVGAGPAAAAVSGGGASFGPGGAGYAGSLVAGANLAAAPAAAQTVGGLGIGATPVAAAPEPAVTPLAGVPAAAAPASAAAARPGTPAYSPAPATAAEPSEE